MATQRSFVTKLPGVRQTTTLQKFFNATVDQVFQPGQLQNINAYIGLKPNYYNPVTDFYKPEYNAERTFYQLEPTMISMDTSNTVQDILFYTDIVNNLRYQGALTNNHERLFDTEYYSWCPPVNLDMLENYRNYYWCPYGPPVMTMTIPVNEYTGDGATTVFQAPKSLPDQMVNVRVKVDYVYFYDYTYDITTNEVTFNTAPVEGLDVKIWTNGDFVINIDGQTSYTYPEAVTAYAVDEHVTNTWDIQDLIDIQATVLDYPAVTIDPAPALVRGMMVEVIDDTWDQPWDTFAWDENHWETNSPYQVNTQKQNGATVLEMVEPYAGLVDGGTAKYWTIERGSDSDNIWSLNNRWYNTELIFYNDNGYSPMKATRPIIQLNKDMKLFNYGLNRLDSVQVVFNGVPAVPTIEQNNDRILVINDSTSAVAAGLYTVQVNAQSQASLVPAETANLYDYVAVDGTTNEYWFNGSTWVLAQAFSATEPLFDLFDNQGNSLANDAVYPNTTFAGSKIFSYSRDTTGTTLTDSVLGFAPVFNQYGSVEFDNDLDIDDATVSGLKYFANATSTNGVSSFDYETNWRYAGPTSQTVDSSTGFYNIPQNLQANPNNDDIEQISINDWFPQFQEIIPANDWLADSSSWTLTGGTDIVQNRGNMLKLMLLSSNASIDMMKSFMYVEREYSRYRAKLVQYLNKMYTTGQLTSVTTALSTALNYLKVTKTSAFSFFNNGMGGDNYYIPASGAYLGLTPLWTPEFVLQNTATGGTVVMLRGHDGSLLPGYSIYTTQNVSLVSGGVMIDGVAQELDIRDQIMLAYEQQLYASCDTSLQGQRRPLFDLKTVQPGKFRTTDYSVSEFNQVATPLFERWAARSQKDFTTNTTYDPNNVWTWNFSQCTDIDGDAIPGYWRGIYRYYFDTDRPDTHPWEMLGYTSEPSWWSNYYSWTNPSQRAALIAAIVAGNVAEPTSTTIDSTFARANFAKFVPVDINGNLLDPLQAGIIVDTSDVTSYALDWEFGDFGPVENSWWNSEYISFTLSELGYLTKPVQFVETGWETLDNYLAHPGQANQWVSYSLGRRKHFSEYIVHNEIVNGTAYRVVGVQQWISDYVKSNGQDITKNFGDHVRGLQVKLANKVGGFTDSNTIQAATESQGTLPSENVTVQMYTSPSVEEFFYGGVIVKWNGKGWAVMGYDVLNPVFTIIPANEQGKSVTISLGEQTSPVRPWLANTFYQTGLQVIWQNAIYQCISTHTSGSSFEQEYWELVSSAPKLSASVKYFTTSQPGIATTTVPYGTVFYTMQEVSNFMAGYELYLKSCGWVFDQFNTDINAANDFRLAVRQFLNWAQIQWAPDTFIALSPLSENVKFSTEFGAVQTVEQMVNGVYSILDRGGNYIDIKNTLVNRVNGDVTVTTKDGSGIYGLRICVSQIEHALIFDNTTIFNDVIYEPLFNLRQNRIRMNYNISMNWTGTYNAPGFVLYGNTMMPSFDRSVEDVRNMFGIEEPVYSVMRDYARHQIGYQSRSYLDDIFSDEMNQFEFYQGMIKQKGTVGALDKLLRNTTLTETTDLQFLEEWAIRIGNYGGVSQESQIEFEITSNDVKQEPLQIDFLAGAEGLDADQLTALQNQDSISLDLYSNNNAYDTRWIYPPKSNLVFPEVTDYTRHVGDLPTAGYVRINEVTVGAPNLATLSSLVQAGTTALNVGSRVWLYSNASETFDVLRADTAVSPVDQNGNPVPAFGGLITAAINPVTGQQITDGSGNLEWNNTAIPNSVVEIEDNVITLLYPTSIQVGEYIYVSSPTFTTPDFSGVYLVTAIDETMTQVTVDDETLFNSNTYTTIGIYGNPAITGASIVEAAGSAPSVLRLFSTRFYESNGGSMASFLGQASLAASFTTAMKTPAAGWANGELIYVDTGYEFAVQDQYAAYQKRWEVFSWNGTAFVPYRTQPKRINRSLVSSVQIFDTVTSITNDSDQLQANPLIYPNVLVYDPVQGLIPGAAKREITFMQENDPALYATGISWGAEQIGRLWWNLGATRFVMAETDDLDVTADSDTELNYRIKNWGALAPNSSVELYEWTQSTMNPTDWTAQYTNSPTATVDGPVYNAADPYYVTEQVWEAASNSYVTYYYFWVMNRLNTPDVSFRSISASSAAGIISAPQTNGIAWIAPVSSNNVIAQEVSQYLTPTSSMQIRIKKNDTKVSSHSQWTLMRPGDPLSVPEGDMFTNLVWSLMGKNALNQPIPNPSLYATVQTGADLKIGQSWFKNLTQARSHLVEYLNNFFGAMNLADERPYALPLLQVVQSNSQYLSWMQSQGSAYLEPIPSAALWNKRFASLEEFRAAYAVDQTVSPALVLNFSGTTPYWSILEIDAEGDVSFAKLWDQQVDSLTALNALVGKVADGTRVMVEANSSTANMWTVWQWSHANTVFELLVTQQYNTNDIFEIVDWYEAGYDTTTPPSAVYAKATDRLVALGENPTVQFTKLLDDGSGSWVWQIWTNGAWVTVAKQNGTIQFNSNIWANTGNTFDVTGTLPSNFATLVANRDMGNELNIVLNVLRESVLEALEVNGLFFTNIDYIHTEQDFVDWIFKTSFMYVQGYDAKLVASPIANVDYTSDLISYINEVKPYHVKIRNFIDKYGVDDTANVHATDFDKPTYFDTTSNNFRLLSEKNADDLAILSSNPEYVDWYNQWTAGDNLVRKIKTTMMFDRVSTESAMFWDTNHFDGDLWDPVPGDDGAVDRVLQYGNGDHATREKLSKIMTGVVFNGPVISGNFAAPQVVLDTLIFQDSGNGKLMATNLPSFVYFAQKFMTPNYVLTKAWDEFNDGTPNYIWNDIDFNIWNQIEPIEWKQMVAANQTGALYSAYEYEFSVPASQFDANSGHRIEVYKRGVRMSLVNGDYVIVPDSAATGSWKIYFKQADFPNGFVDTEVIIMLVAADNPSEVIDGGTLTPETYNQIISGGLFQDPLHQANHPEELVTVFATAGVRIKMHQTWLPGSAIIETYQSPNPMGLPMVPQSKQGIALFDNGVRVAQSNYSYNASTLAVNYLGADNPDRLDSVLFGLGGVNTIKDTDYFVGDGKTKTFTVTATFAQASDLFVRVNGILATNFTVSVTANTLTFATAPAAGLAIDVAIMPSMTNIYGTMVSAFNIVNVQEVKFSSLGGPVNFNTAFGLSATPDWTTSIVEVDGLRKMPTAIYEQDITAATDTIVLPSTAQYGNLTATLNGTPILIATDVCKSFTIPTTRSVFLGSNWGYDDLTVTYNGAALTIGHIVGTAPGYPMSNMNPAAPELNTTVLVNGVLTPKYTVQPANADLVVYRGYLMKINQAINSPMAVKVSYLNTIPDDLTGVTWDVPGNSTAGSLAAALMVGDEIRVINGQTGKLYVFDATQGQFNANAALTTQFPNASMISLTTFSNANVMNIATATYNTGGDNWYMVPGMFKNKPQNLWVTLNGKKLREGADYYLTPAYETWDQFAWDEIPFDEEVTFLPGWDNTIWDQDLWDEADMITQWVLCTNVENGVVVGSTDYLVITSFGEADTQATAPYDEIYVLDPLREYGGVDIKKSIKFDDYFVLSGNLDETTTSIVLTQTAKAGAPSSSTFNTGRSILNPGVMMLGAEMIQFVDASVNATTGTITLSNVQRGFKGSSALAHTGGSTVIDLTV